MAQLIIVKELLVYITKQFIKQEVCHGHRATDLQNDSHKARPPQMPVIFWTPKTPIVAFETTCYLFNIHYIYYNRIEISRFSMHSNMKKLKIDTVIAY